MLSLREQERWEAGADVWARFESKKVIDTARHEAESKTGDLLSFIGSKCVSNKIRKDLIREETAAREKLLQNGWEEYYIEYFFPFEMEEREKKKK